MTTIGHIAWKELRTYFTSWMAYILCAGWLFLSGLIFVLLVAQAAEAFGQGQFSLSPLYNNLIVVLLFIAPLLTMRLVAEERTNGSLEMLFTSPLSEWQVAIGKWLGALAFCLLLFVLTLHYPGFALRYGTLDSGPLWGAYLALFCLACAFCAFGLFCSSLTESQVVAGFLTFGGLLGSWMLSWIPQAAPSSAIAGFIGQFSLFTHFEEMLNGAVELRDLVFFVSVTAFFLFATVRVLESRKWR